MPLYDYQCQACGVYHEVHSSMSDRKDIIECPRCHGDAEQVILSAPGIMTGSMGHQTQDVAIGRDAEQRWDRIHEKKAMRDKARRESGVNTITATKGEGNEIVFRPVKKDLQFVGTKGTERED